MLLKQDDSVETPEDDLIDLNGCGRKSRWRFPANVLKCPGARNCQQIFKTRSAVIRHYKENHTEGSILCPLCDKPIKTNSTFDYYVAHYRRIHPFKKIPFVDDDGDYVLNAEQMTVQTETV